MGLPEVLVVHLGVLHMRAHFHTQVLKDQWVLMSVLHDLVLMDLLHIPEGPLHFWSMVVQLLGSHILHQDFKVPCQISPSPHLVLKVPFLISLNLLLGMKVLHLISPIHHQDLNKLPKI